MPVHSIIQLLKVLKVDHFLYLVHILIVSRNAKIEEDWYELLLGAVVLQRAEYCIHRLSSEAKAYVMRTKLYVFRGTKRRYIWYYPQLLHRKNNCLIIYYGTSQYHQIITFSIKTFSNLCS